ncbi:MAG: hydrogenase maturation protease [Terracidiphilus sp.]|jgi:hydrogenase maturation protease
MALSSSRCLVLACGNTLREDDGAGPWLAEWAEERFRNEAGVRVVSRQQWTPELAEEIAGAEDVLFIDCSANSAPGLVCLAPVTPSTHSPRLLGHQLSAADLLALGRELYASLPRQALLLTIGAGSTELGEKFSPAVTVALPDACRLIEETVLRLLTGPELG